MTFACWIPKATNTQSEYLILTAFPRLRWLRDRPSKLSYTYIVSLVWNCVETQLLIIQGDQKVSVHLMITIQKVTSNVQSVPRQSPDIY
jgi:hypothetical protein